MISPIHLGNATPKMLKIVKRMGYYVIKPSWMRLFRLWGTFLLGI